MKKQYVQIELKDYGKYIQPATKQDVMSALDGELDGLEGGYMSPGTEIKLTVIEMEENEYKALPEFAGH